MEPITISLISKAIGYLTKGLGNSKSFKEFTEEFSEATVDWIKPIFLKSDETPKEVLTDLISAPADELNIQAAENAMAKAIRSAPELEDKLRTLVEEIAKKEGAGVNKVNDQKFIGDENIGIQDISESEININKGK